MTTERPSAPTPGFIRDLRRILGPARVLTDREHRIGYSFDATFQTGVPGVVVLPRSAAEAAAVVAMAAGAGVPVFPRGAGTGLSGGSVPSGGLALVLTGLNRILEVDRENMQVRVEAGVVTGELQGRLEAQGLFYPPDPGSAQVATIGGNIAENAGGPRAFKYGVTGNYVLGLDLVLASGERLTVGGRTLKNVSGYDLSRLMVGSEGTLAVVTAATLRIIARPPARRTITAVFDRLEDAGAAIGAAVSSPVFPASLEIMDNACIRAVESFQSHGLPQDAAALVLAEVDGWEEAVAVQGPALAGLFRRAGARRVEAADSEGDGARLWRARRAITAAVAAIRPTKISEDATVPPGRVAEFIGALAEIRDRYGIQLVVFGHAGDGNLHPNILCDQDDREEMARVDQAVTEIFAAALDLGGTLSGEHGIGTLKAPYLEQALGPVGLGVMRRLKEALDPRGILNPGKIFPPEVT